MGQHKKTYLILADESEEFQVALHYAAISAKIKDANVAVLHVLPETEFQPWGDVEERMKAEQREEAEAQMNVIADQIEAVHGERPQIIIVDEGMTSDALIRVTNEDPIITKVILAGSVSPSGPGPLIEYFAGKGIEELNVALAIIPGHLTKDEIEALI